MLASIFSLIRICLLSLRDRNKIIVVMEIYYSLLLGFYFIILGYFHKVIFSKLSDQHYNNHVKHVRLVPNINILLL